MFAGVFWGYIEGFLFWFLDDLGASKLQMGWTVTVGMVTSLPFLVFSGPITEKLGHVTVIIIGMLAYFIRLLGYSFVQRPEMVYPFEALEGFTMALMMTSAVTYVAKISTQTTIASVMGLMGSLFFGVGKGSGCLFGGICMSYLGSITTFRLFAGLAGTCALIYFIFQMTYIRPKRHADRKLRQDSEGEDERDTPKDSETGIGEGKDDIDTKNRLQDNTNMTASILQDEAGGLTSCPDGGSSSPVPGSLSRPGSLSHGPGSLLSINGGPRSLTGGTRV